MEMKTKMHEFKKFLNSLPEEYYNFSIVYREYYSPLKNGDILIKDTPITSIEIDEKTKEICFIYEDKDETETKKI